MEMLLPKPVHSALLDLASFVAKDPHAELECKVLAGQIHTKDVSDRIVKAIETMSTGAVVEEHRATFSYADGLRVVVVGAENIHKVCTTGAFRGVPLAVETKRRYFDAPGTAGTDVLDVPDLQLRFTLRSEKFLRKDFSGAPMDPTSHCRILHRKSWKSLDGLLQFDMSMTKSKTKNHKTFADILRQTPAFELEVEIIDRKAPKEKLVSSLLSHVETLVGAFQGSPFLLSQSDQERYRMEFDVMHVPFLNPVTMERMHVRADRPHNILTGYTVTNKADGQRCFLVVMRDKRLLRITKNSIAWTGMTANKDSHIGDIMDGEFLPDRNLFCIFDVYSFRGKDTRRLPLMTNDEDVMKNPTKSRLGCAREFVQDTARDFNVLSSRTPLRIETKLFLAGDGVAMEQAIVRMFETVFEYPTDGLVFTPRTSPVAPIADRSGETWLRVYKWKPPTQNSIDFLVRFKAGESYDQVLGKRVFQGSLYVSRSPGSDIIYPCETMTGEYVPPTMPDDLRVVAETKKRIPSFFQPSVPRAPEAYKIRLPLNVRGVPEDEEGKRIEDNTIIECVYDTDIARWKILRTRYDKTYAYRVKGEPQYGNDIKVADSIWTNIHVPVTEEMLRSITTNPPDDTFEDELYYRDNLDSRDRVLKDVYGFHNRIKESLFESNIKRGDTLLELAMGRGGDIQKWKRTKPSKVVGIELSASNLSSPRQGACVRYIKERTLPPALFIVGDMTLPLFEQDSPYFRLLEGTEPPATAYLSKFAGLKEFDVISCQMAMHYACGSEEMFKVFLGNLTKFGKGLFFGTCLDGQAVYSLLLGKTGHVFRAQTQKYGEFKKEYADGEGWTEEFGKGIQVELESFEKPVKEYLVPFGKITELMKEAGYQLVETTMFADHYARQNNITLTQEHQNFSFLHRSFVFKRVKVEPKQEEQVVDIPTIDMKEEESKAAPKEEPKEESKEEPKAPAKKRMVKIPKDAAELPDPVLFSGADEGKGEWRGFSTMYEAPFQVDGITFPTLEHYVQWSKAKMFGDAATEAKILKTKTAKAVKTLGDKVKDAKEDEWDKKKDEFMRVGLKAKFMQHPDLRAKLMETKDRPIGEANARDKYWGIGTSADTSKAKDPSKWPGKNVLGKMLEALRTELSE